MDQNSGPYRAIWQHGTKLPWTILAWFALPSSPGLVQHRLGQGSYLVLYIDYTSDLISYLFRKIYLTDVPMRQPNEPEKLKLEKLYFSRNLMSKIPEHYQSKANINVKCITLPRTTLIKEKDRMQETDIRL